MFSRILSSSALSQRQTAENYNLQSEINEKHKLKVLSRRHFDTMLYLITFVFRETDPLKLYVEIMRL